ncbi:MAG TPA: TetR/AcrR family transcriptional regulator [Clostridia bacterium]
MRNEQKKDIRIERTKRLLAKALFELLETVPFEKISVMDICEKAMVHRATFYNHFDSKEQLLEYAMEELKESLYQSAVKKDTYENEKEMYISLIDKVIDFVQENKQKILLVLKQNSFEKAAGFIISSIKKSLKYLINKNQNEQNYAVPKNMLIDFLSGGITNIGLNWLQSPNPCSKQELMNYFNILLNDKIFSKA